jgi:hypothetical protein
MAAFSFGLSRENVKRKGTQRFAGICKAAPMKVLALK